MADDVQVFNITCAPNTLASAPLEFVTVRQNIYELSRVVLVIPDGHAGLTGIAIAFGHEPVFPSNAGAYFSGNDETYTFDMEGNPPGVPWSVFVCNEDTQPHSWQTRWELTRPTVAPVIGPPAPLSGADIVAAGLSG